jgi:ribosomal-protein-alanine N-acetyltransferase
MVTRASVHPAAPEDVDVLAALHSTSFAPAWTAKELAWMLDPPGLGLIAMVAGEAAGFVLARAIGDEAEIMTLAVPPRHRRAGIATLLLGTLIEVLSRRAVASLFLEVAADNTAALRLYNRANFAESGRRRGYYIRSEAPAVDAIVMVRPLNRVRKQAD